MIHRHSFESKGKEEASAQRKEEKEEEAIVIQNL